MEAEEPRRPMSLKGRLAARARLLKQDLAAVFYAYRDPRLRVLPRVIIAIAIAYALSPIDLIPDFIPVIGYLDDLIIIPALLSLAIALIPDGVMSEARARAKSEPLSLRRNWLFAAIFIGIWITLILAAVAAALRWAGLRGKS